MLYKKGLSTIVATVTLVLLTVLAVTIIAGFIIPLVRDSLKDSTACVNYNDHFTFDDSFGYNCYNSSSGGSFLYAVSIRASGIDDDAEKEIGGLKLMFSSSTGSEVINVVNGPVTGSVRMINSSSLLIVPKGGGVKTYVYNGTLGVEKVSVSTFLKSNGKLCGVSDEIKIDNNPCDASTILEVT